MAFLLTCSNLPRPFRQIISSYILPNALFGSLLVFSSWFMSCLGVISLYLHTVVASKQEGHFPMSVETTVRPRSFSSASPLRFTRLFT